MALDHSPSAEGSDPDRNSSDPIPQASVLHRFVTFYAGEIQYAIPATAVAEVTGHLSPIALPDSPRSLSGIAPHRGDILAIVDTGTSSSRVAEPAKRKTIILRPIGDKVELPVAFNVDRIGEILQIGASQIASSTVGDALAEFEVSGMDHKVLIVEPSRIVDLLVS